MSDKVHYKGRLQRASLVFYLGLDAITPPVNFLHCIRLKFVPVSNMALIFGEGPPNILLPLDAIQKRTIKLIGDSALINSLDSLAHRRTISALSLYYIYIMVSVQSIIPPKALFTRNTRFSNAQHPFAVKLNKNRNNVSNKLVGSLWFE